MRIQQYSVMLDENYHNILVKDFTKNCPEIDKLENPRKIIQVMDEIFHLRDRAEEFVYLIGMTAKCRPVGFFEVSHGTSTAATISMREIMIRALLCGATNLVLVHNHPSGVPEPSKEDIKITRQLHDACSLMNIEFCDHIIIARDACYSMRSEEWL